MTPADRVFWRSDTCTVWVRCDDRGALVFSGQDRAHLDGYEYVITVPSDQLQALRQAMRADPAADVVDLVCDRVDAIMAHGERTWLDDHGIDDDFSSY